MRESNKLDLIHANLRQPDSMRKSSVKLAVFDNFDFQAFPDVADRSDAQTEKVPGEPVIVYYHVISTDHLRRMHSLFPWTSRRSSTSSDSLRSRLAHSFRTILLLAEFLFASTTRRSHNTYGTLLVVVDTV